MKNNYEIERLKSELDDWVRGVGWKTVAWEISNYFEKYGKGELLCSLNYEPDKALKCNRQRIQRAFSFDSYQYKAKALALAPYIIAAMPAERRARLTAPKSINYLASLALKECTEAVNALLLGSAPARLEKEISEAINSLIAMKHIKADVEV